jgi:hypothetical protein
MVVEMRGRGKHLGVEHEVGQGRENTEPREALPEARGGRKCPTPNVESRFAFPVIGSQLSVQATRLPLQIPGNRQTAEYE